MATRLAILCAGILAVGLAGVANPVAAQQRDWLGTYAGIMIGHSWDRIDFSVPIGGGTSSDHSATSVIGGAQIGSYVARQGNFRFGVVADVLLLDARLDAGASETTTTIIDTCGDGCFVQTTVDRRFDVAMQVHWKSSLRANVGWTISPSVLVYATAGVALTRLDVSATLTETTTVQPQPPVALVSAASGSQLLAGYVVGVGAATWITPQVSAFAQVLHYDFAVKRYELLGLGVKLDLDETVVAVGLNFHFN